ncbi:homoserine acetyltransferase [Arthrobacter pascens]|nr:homoserine acetyltransferase [Arthrobacter pascens]
MGGARALEWAVSYPERVRRCGVISIGASSTAEQIAFAQTQTLAIRQDVNFKGGDYYGGPEPTAGLALARRIAHFTYRSAEELDGLVPEPEDTLAAPRAAQQTGPLSAVEKLLES